MNDEYVTKELFDAKIETLLVLYDDTNKRIDDLKDSMNRHFAVLSVMFGMLQVGIAVILYFLH